MTMRLNLKKLRDMGYHVEADKDAVTVYGNRPMPFLQELIAALESEGFSRGEADYLAGDLAVTVEQKLILRDGAE